MLGIEFLNRLGELRFDGQEFMDYQKGDLFKDLVKILEKTIVPSQDVDGYQIVENEELADKIEEAIFQQTGILTTFHLVSNGNAGVNAGYLNPGNLLDLKGMSDFFSARDSNIGQAFRRLRTDVLKGWVDTSTGKVGGDYSKINFDFAVNRYVSFFIENKFIQRYKITMPEAVAAIIIHELGHVFSGLLYIARTTIDSIVATAAIKLIVEGKAYGKERATIIRDSFKIMEVPQKVDEADVADLTGSELTVYFDKAVGTRDTRRTLSLGTQDRASEIYADLYAARMGCPKQLIAALASGSKLPGYSMSFPTASTAATIVVMLTCSPILGVLCGVNSIFLILYYFSTFLSPNDLYDSPYRRVKTILRDHVVQINQNKDLDSKIKTRLLLDAKEMEKIVSDMKPFLEGTWVQRTVGYIFNGSDFRAQEFEHYTDELIGHTVSLYKNAI